MSCLWRGVKCFYEDLEILTFLVILDIGTDGMEGGCCGQTCPSSPLTKVEMVRSETVPPATASVRQMVVQHLWWKSKHSAMMEVEGMEHQESCHEGLV